VDQPPPNEEFRLSTREGLPSKKVHAIAQLKDGGMVFGTDLGLAIWKGDLVTTYLLGPMRTNDGRTWGHPANDIQDVLVGSDGALWLGTGKGVYRRRKNQWQLLLSQTTTPLRATTPTWYDTNDVMCLSEDSRGRIVAGSRNASVAVIDPGTNAVRQAFLTNDPNQWVTGIAEDGQKNLWVAVYGLGVIRFSGSTVRLFTDVEQWIPDLNIRSFVLTPDGTHYVGATRLGVRRPDGSSEVLSAPDVLPEKTVWRMTRRRDGTVWCRTSLGYAVYDGSRWRFAGGPGADGPYGDMFEGADGTFWVSSWRGVVRRPAVRLSSRNPRVQKIQDIKKRIETDYPNVKRSRALLLDHRKRVWARVLDTPMRYDGHTWEDLSSMTGGKDIYVLFEDSKQRVWMGSAGAGLIGFEQDKVIRYNHEENNSRSVIYDIAEDSHGRLYVATQGGLFSLHEGRWTNFLDRYLAEGERPKARGLPLFARLQILCVAVDSADRLWFASNSDLFLYDGKRVLNVSFEGPLKGTSVGWLTARPDGRVLVQGTALTPEGRKQKSFVCDGVSCKEVTDGE